MDIPIDNACFFTGHRTIPQNKLPLIAELLENTCALLITKYGITEFIAGGALGFDTLAARTILKLRKKYDIHLHIFIPCIDQTMWWSVNEKNVWEQINKAADSVRYISDKKHTRGCMQQRNRAMVDSAMFGVAYCTKPSGGTYYTLQYAKNHSRSAIVFTDNVHNGINSLSDIPFTLIQV